MSILGGDKHAQLRWIDTTFVERTDLGPKMKDLGISDIAIYFIWQSPDYDNIRFARQPSTLLALQSGYGNYSTKQHFKMRLMMTKASTPQS